MKGSGLIEFIPFIYTSAIWGQSLFTLLLAFPQHLSSHHGGLQHPWIEVLGALTHIWKPEITDGSDISCLLIWLEIFSFHNMMLDRGGLRLRGPAGHKAHSLALKQNMIFKAAKSLPYLQKIRPSYCHRHHYSSGLRTQYDDT